MTNVRFTFLMQLLRDKSLISSVTNLLIKYKTRTIFNTKLLKKVFGFFCIFAMFSKSMCYEKNIFSVLYWSFI